MPVARRFGAYRGRDSFSVGYTHRIADPPAEVQTCTHALIVRWRNGWRGIVWQVQR